MMVRFHPLPLAVAAAAILSLTGTREASATVHTGISPANLQATINSAIAGDEIYVTAGSTNQYIVVNKSLIIHGAQAGVPGYATSRSSESVLNNGIQVSADNVTLEGFTISGGDLQGDFSGTGVYLPNRFVNSLILANNIIQDNTFGVFLNGTNHIVQNNLFRSNNRPGAASGDGIYSEFGLTNTLITNNMFTSNKNGAVVVLGGLNGGTADGITLLTNTIKNDGTIAFYGSSNVSITANLSWNTKNGHGLILGGGNSHVIVTGNQFLNSMYRGIRVSNGAKYPAVNSDIRITDNDIADNKLGGLSVVPGSYSDSGSLSYDQHVDGNVDAECNAWGAINGPAPSGSGDKVSGPVDATPYQKYMDLSSLVSVTRLSTIAGAGGSYLQVVRITNNGAKAVVGGAYFAIDGLSTYGITWNNPSSGSTDDPCQPPVGSPWYRFTAPGSTLAPGGSLIVTLKFTASGSFDINSIGGESTLGKRILATSFR